MDGRLAHALDRIRRSAALLGTPASEAESGHAERDFRVHCAAVAAPVVLELGTLQSQAGRSTMHRDWVPHAAEFLGTDIEAGADVDIVADLHRLTETTGAERFDAIISCSTFEHLKYPHIVAHELMRALRVGGVLFVQTHQTFPLHGYPSDYFRFSREGLASLFGTEMGFRVAETGYDFPARILSRRVADVTRHPAFLNVKLWGEKVAPTPEHYRYDLG
jgi:SAM-dependent methyltransferase